LTVLKSNNKPNKNTKSHNDYIVDISTKLLRNEKNNDDLVNDEFVNSFISNEQFLSIEELMSELSNHNTLSDFKLTEDFLMPTKLNQTKLNQ
jgi:hypothetical protein